MESTAPARPADRALLVSVLTGCSVVLTALTGLVVGWFAVGFQLMGAQPDTGDHAVAAGAYGAATVAVLLGAATLHDFSTTPWQLPATVAAGVVLGLLAVRAVADATTAQPGWGSDGWWDGARAVLVCPWVWWLAAAGIRVLTRSRAVTG